MDSYEARTVIAACAEAIRAMTDALRAADERIANAAKEVESLYRLVDKIREERS